MVQVNLAKHFWLSLVFPRIVGKGNILWGIWERVFDSVPCQLPMAVEFKVLAAQPSSVCVVLENKSNC